MLPPHAEISTVGDITAGRRKRAKAKARGTSGGPKRGTAAEVGRVGADVTNTHFKILRRYVRVTHGRRID